MVKEWKMVNFKLGETNVKMNLSACYERGTKKKIWIPDRIRTYDLPNTERALYPLELQRTHGERGHVLGSPHSTTSTLLILAVCRMRVKYEPETHKGLKRVTRVHLSWIFTFTIFGKLVKDIHFQQNCCLAITMRWWPDFCISRLRQKMGRESSKECSVFFSRRKGSFSQ